MIYNHWLGTFLFVVELNVFSNMTCSETLFCPPFLNMLNTKCIALKGYPRSFSFVSFQGQFKYIFIALLLLVLISTLVIYYTSTIEITMNLILKRSDVEVNHREHSTLYSNGARSLVGSSHNEVTSDERDSSMRKISQQITKVSVRPDGNRCPLRLNFSLEDIQIKHIPNDLYKLAPEVRPIKKGKRVNYSEQNENDVMKILDCMVK